MLEVQLLGHLAIADSGHRVAAVPNPRLIGFLLLNRDRPVERTEVAFTLWPDSSDAQALTNLRRELHALRRALPDADQVLAVERRTLRWRPDGPFHLDVAAFEDAVEHAAEGGVEALRAAVAMYRGDLLPGVYDDWIEPHRDRLRTMMLEALNALATRLEQRREYRAAMEQLRRLVAIDPLAETRYQALMRVAAIVGDRTAGLRAYHACVSALRDELGIEPSPETQNAYRRLVTLDMPEVAARAGSDIPAQPELVGRDPEWKALVDGWNRGVSGALTLALIQGDAGIGKSRLIEEFSRWGRAQGATVLAARSWAVEGSLAYAPVTAWLRSAPLRPLLDGLDDVWLSELSRLLPELLADHPGLAAPAPMLESWQRQRLFEALAQAMRGARAQPLLVLDDANWADSDTLEWLHFMLRTAAVAGFVILGARSGEVESNRALASLVSDARNQAELLDIELGPLSEAETATLAAATAHRPLDAAAHARLYHETEGHPLFVVEMAQAGLPGTAAPDSAERAGGGPSPAPARMTARMRAVIATRLQQLTPTAQRVVEVAAAIGRDFDVDILAASAELDEPDLVEGLDELWRRRIIREHGVNRYDFSHDRIREVAYDQIAPAGRRVLHRRVAQALELRHHDDIDPIAAQLASQLESAGQAARACALYERAAAVAARVLASAKATRHLSRALAILAESPASRDRDVFELRLLLLLSRSLLAVEGYASRRQEATVERARALAAELGEEIDELFALNGLWSVRVVGGDVDRSLEVAEAALRRSDRHPDFASASHLAMGGSLTFLGEQEKAVIEFKQAIAAYVDGASRPLTSGTDAGVFALSWGAHALWLGGRTATATEWSNRAVTLAGSLEGPQMTMIALSYAAILDQIQGDVELMRAHSRAAAELCSRYDFAYYAEWHVILTAWADRGVGSDSASRIESALDALRSIRGLARRPYYLSLLADAHQAADHPRQAREVLKAALADAAASGERWWVPELHRRLGMLDDGPNGEAAIRRALDLAFAQGAWSLALRAAISLARRAPSEQATLRAVLDAVPEPPPHDRLEAEAALAGARESRTYERERERFPNDRCASLSPDIRLGRLHMATASGARPLDQAAIGAMAASFRGQLIRREDPGYDDARRVFNAAVDRRPALIARPVDVGDIKAALQFGIDTDLKIAVRGGGHHGAGFGSVDDGLVIDLGRLRGIRVDPVAGTVRVEPGCTLADLDHATHAFGLAVPTGIFGTTGIAGLTLGGGVGHLTRKFGLTLDNLLEADVLLASGELVTASATTNDEVFWAIRGGGGNFGIVTSFLFRAHPVSTIVGGPTLYELDQAADVLRWYRDFMPAAPPELNGFFAFLTVPPAPPFPEHLHLKKMAGIVWCHSGDPSRAAEVYAPIRAFGPPALDGIQPMPFPVLQTAFDPLYPAGLRWHWRADFVATIPDDAVAEHVRFAATLPTWQSGMHLYPIDGAVHDSDQADTAFSYRDARWAQVMVGVDEDESTSAATAAWTTDYWEALHPYSAGGAYVNMYMDEGQDRVRTSYRANYDRLVRAKSQFDPKNVFRLNQNIRPG